MSFCADALNLIVKGNILVSDDGQALLSDFELGYFSRSRPDKRCSASLAILRAGSYQWMAYELLTTDPSGTKASEASDIWAFAMVVIEVSFADRLGKSEVH